MSLFHRDTPEEAAFRNEVREWLEANVPAETRHELDVTNPEISREWHRKLWERGWIAPHWPKEYGGMGGTVEQQVILMEELARVGGPYVQPSGLNFLGFAIMSFGTERQKRELLPGILSGETTWCQGYSEPEAGSDLASLRTRATLEGDHWVVNGQKIWSSGAPHCDRMFALVRTDPDPKARHAGISMLLIDLKTPGLTVTPIQTLTGHVHFSIVTFDGVRVPREDILGEVNQGWKVANHVLTYERISGSSPKHDLIAIDVLQRLARQNGRDRDPAFQERLGRAGIDVIAHIAMHRFAVEQVKAGKSLGFNTSAMKIAGADALHGVTDLLLDAAGTDAASEEKPLDDGQALDALGLFLLSRRATIWGGAAEIQRNIIAERILGFPRSWR